MCLRECNMNTIQTQLLESLNEFTAFARKQLADPELAADAVQESLLKALKAADQVRDEKNTKAWFYRILWRTSASMLYNRALGNGRNFASALVWGQNDPESGERENSYLLEADLQLKKFAIYTRLESVQKAGHELGLENFDERLFRIQALMLGAGREIHSTGGVSLQLGAQATLYQVNDDLEPFYGSQPFSFAVYLQLRPSLLKMSGHGMHGMKGMKNGYSDYRVENP